MGFESTLSIIVAVIVVACNCEPDPQYLVGPYQHGVLGAVGRSQLPLAVPRTFGFPNALVTFTYSTTTITSTLISTSTSTCTTSTAPITTCARRRRRGVQIAEESMTDNDNWFLLPSAPHSVKSVEENTPVHTIDSLRQSRQLDSENNGLLYASELGVGDLSGSIPARALLFSLYVSTSTSLSTSTSTVTASLTAICQSTTAYSLCT